MLIMPYLQRRGETWYFYRRVPSDIRQVIGADFIRKSLGTGDRALANKLVLEHIAASDRQFDRARAGWRRLPEPDYGVMATEFASWLSEQLGLADHIAKMGRGRLPEPVWSVPVETRSSFATSVDAWVKWTLGDPDSPIRSETDGFRPDQADRSRLIGEAVEAYRRLLEQTGSPVPKWMTQGDRKTEPALEAATPLDTSGPTVRDLFETWQRERKLRSKSLAEYRRIFDDFVDFLDGDLAARAVTRDQVRGFKDLLLVKPAKLSKTEAAMPLNRLLALVGENHDRPTITIGTVRKHLTAISSVFGWAERNGYITRNPVTGIQPSKRPVQATRRPYSIEDLNRIFRWPIWTGAKGPARLTEPGSFRTDGSKFWLPLLALYTGARLEELGQLDLIDVGRQARIDYFHFHQYGLDKSLKNVGSERRVPIHRDLIDLGFMGYVDRLRTAGQVRLFPDLTPSQPGGERRWTTNFSKWWGRYRTDMGLADPAKPFHAFRHTFKDAARNSDIDRAKYDELQGHHDGTASAGYGLGSSLDSLNRAIQKLRFDGLDLSHLKRS